MTEAETQEGPSTPVGRAAVRALLRPVRARIAVACGLQAITAVATVVPFVAIVELAREVLRDPTRSSRVWEIVWVAVAALALRFVTGLAAEGITHFADPDLQLDVRRQLARRLGQVPLGWFGDRNSGRVKKTLNDDVAALHHLVGHAYLNVTTASVTPVAIIGYLLAVDWRLTLISLVPTAVGFFGYHRMVSGQKDKLAVYQGALGDVAAAAVEFVDGIAVVKAFGPDGRAHTRFTEAADNFIDTFWGWARGMLRGSTLAELALAPFTTLLIVLAAGIAFVQGDLCRPIDVLPFIVLGPAIAGPFLQLNYAQSYLLLSRLAAANILEILDTEVLPATTRPGTPVDSQVRFEGVHFSYGRSDTEVIRGIDLDLAPGTITALVGPSGAGKSTVAALLARFWDPSAGRITVGGVDLRDLAADQLYRHIGLVLQDIRLITASVADNIRLARPAATDADVEAAARAANIHDVIVALPYGYETVLGEQTSLSGGQAQRVAIARALLADTPVLVLDEATAFADPDSEALIQDALSVAAAGRTVLVVAHRLRTVQSVDQIYVMDHGRVVQRGRHDELAAADGLYRRLWELPTMPAASEATGPDRVPA